MKVETMDELHAFCATVSLPAQFGFTKDAVMAFADGDEQGITIDFGVLDRETPGARTEISNSFRFRLPVERDYLAWILRIKTLDLLCHEADEWIVIEGRTPFDPHSVSPPMSYEEMCRTLVKNKSATKAFNCPHCQTLLRPLGVLCPECGKDVRKASGDKKDDRR